MLPERIIRIFAGLTACVGTFLPAGPHRAQRALRASAVLLPLFAPAALIAQTAAHVDASDSIAWQRVVSLELSRTDTTGIRQLADIAHTASPEVRRIAIRALGRLQRPDAGDVIATFLHDPSATLRAEAAHAFAMANIAARPPATAPRDVIRNALADEHDPIVIAALAEVLGRFRFANADSARAAASQLAALAERNNPVITLGAIRGIHFIVRQPAAIRPGVDAARTTLIRVATSVADTTMTARHARRLATETLALAGLGDEATATAIMRDADPFVRREVMLMGAAPAADTAVARRILLRGLRDTAWNVRYEAVRQLGIRFPATSCADVTGLAKDASVHVRVQAIDVLGTQCVATPGTASLLDSIARALPAGAESVWQPAAHALVALASRDRALAAARLPAFARHANLFVRTYAAVAADTLRDTATLRALASDAHPNVRTAAVHGLHRIAGHDADALYIEQLKLDDSQLLMEAAAALDSTQSPNAAARMLDALDRVTAQKRENSRDGRMALLNAAARTGGSALASRVKPYLRDFDPAIASRAALLLRSLLPGENLVAEPQPLPPEALPSFAELRAMENAIVTVEMQNGGSYTLRMLPFDAPVNASRFVRLAKSGWYNGLALHRIEPTFVVQGGSPNANEYTGAPRFSRDEIGYPNDRATVGLSTRGHDTGDAQIYINTIDNTQLDPFFTIFAVVTRGMEVVDRILEGERIRRITVR